MRPDYFFKNADVCIPETPPPPNVCKRLQLGTPSPPKSCGRPLWTAPYDLENLLS